MWVAVWFVFCLLVILFVWVMVFYILYKKRELLDIRILAGNGQPLPGIKVYGYRNSRIFNKTYAGPYGGQHIIAAEPETWMHRSFIGHTDAEGYLQKTFWLHHYHTLEFMSPEGNLVQRRGDKLLMNPDMVSRNGPILVYLP